MILAACSTFMRDQFLLTQSKHVRITILQSAEVAENCCSLAILEHLKLKERAFEIFDCCQLPSDGSHCGKVQKLLSKYLEIDLSMKNNNQHVDLCQSSTVQMLRMKMKIQIKTVRSLKFQKIVL